LTDPRRLPRGDQPRRLNQKGQNRNKILESIIIKILNKKGLKIKNPLLREGCRGQKESKRI
jgi:hypothetical protein